MPKTMPNARGTGVGGTVDAFNFIGRVTFPSTRRVIAIFAAIAVVSVTVSFLVVEKNLLQAAILAGGVIVWPAIVGELLSSKLFLRRDRVLDFRRLMGIEVISVIVMAGFLMIFSVIGAAIGTEALWEDGFLVGFAVSLPVRFMTPVAMSSMSAQRKLSAALPTPLLTIVSFLILSRALSVSSNPTLVQIALLIVSVLVLSALGVSSIVKDVETEGMAQIHYSPMELFRSFLDHWLKKSPAALEERLLSLSTDGSIETKILSFSGENSPPKASIVVSNFHPGPYRDMGSGGLPSELKRYLERSQSGIVQVPHGISNHKLNIVSRKDVNKLLLTAREKYPSSHQIRTASPMIREQEGEAKVSGQAFGNVALLTITLAPEEMEDLPMTVAAEIEREASRLGFEVLIIDSHNSIVSQTSITPVQAERIIAAAVRVLAKLKLLPQGPFRAGSAYDPLTSYSLKDGIGPGGLSVLALGTKGSNVSYITIDGNNMQRGLRDQILESIEHMGISDAEIMTTDTHLVTGLVSSPLGYYPVGTALATASFVIKITETVQTAITNLDESSAGFSKFSLQLKVLGSETFQSITSFIGRVGRQIARSFYWLEISALVLALVVLFVV